MCASQCYSVTAFFLMCSLAVIHFWCFLKFQTDVIAFPGASGGPIINSDGKVIGMLSLSSYEACIEWRRHGYICRDCNIRRLRDRRFGRSFAISIPQTSWIVDTLKKYGCEIQLVHENWIWKKPKLSSIMLQFSWQFRIANIVSTHRFQWPRDSAHFKFLLYY